MCVCVRVCVCVCVYVSPKDITNGSTLAESLKDCILCIVDRHRISGLTHNTAQSRGDPSVAFQVRLSLWAWPSRWEVGGKQTSCIQRGWDTARFLKVGFGFCCFPPGCSQKNHNLVKWGRLEEEQTNTTHYTLHTTHYTLHKPSGVWDVSIVFLESPYKSWSYLLISSR